MSKPRAGRGGSGALWWILGGAGLIAVIIGSVVLLPPLLTGRSVFGDPQDPSGTGSPQSELCRSNLSTTTAPAIDADGRVRAGRLSSPVLGPPWSGPAYDDRIPFARDTAAQIVVTETGGGLPTWQAMVLIAELTSGDGFFSPEQGAEIVTECLVDSFYGAAAVRDDQRNEAITIDGHDALITETQVSFDLPGIQATDELLITLVIRTSDVTSGLFHLSVPGTDAQLARPAKDLIDDLRVDG